MKHSKLLASVLLALLLPFTAYAAEDESSWTNTLKPEFFAKQAIEESDKVIDRKSVV